MKIQKIFLCIIILLWAHVYSEKTKTDCIACLKKKKTNLFEIPKGKCHDLADDKIDTPADNDNFIASKGIAFCDCFDQSHCAGCTTMKQKCGWDNDLRMCVPSTNQNAAETCARTAWAAVIIIPVVMVLLGIGCFLVAMLIRRGTWPGENDSSDDSDDETGNPLVSEVSPAQNNQLEIDNTRTLENIKDQVEENKDKSSGIEIANEPSLPTN